MQAQNRAMQKEEIKKIASEQKKKLQKKETNFTLECRGCRKVKVDGSCIRLIDGKHHVVIGRDLEDNGDVEIKLFPTKSVDNVQFLGHVVCKREQSKKPTTLGTTMKSHEVSTHVF
jgi:hypothetical protein